MKTSKIAAGGLGITLVAAMTLGGAVSSASAADFFVTTLGDEGSSYPEGWFTGTITIPAEEGTADFTPYGLEVTGKKQILNGTPVATGLTQLANNTFTGSDNNDWYFQIPVFGDTANQTDFTTLRPQNQGYQNSATLWVTSGAIRNSDDTGNAFAAGAVATLEAFEDAFDAQTFAAYEILAYGYFFDNGADDTLFYSEYGSDTYYFVPEPTLTITPSPVGLDAFKTAGKGITISGTGAYPLSEVYFDLYAPTGPGVNVGPADVDAEGNFSITYVAPATAVVGTYTVDAFNPEYWEQSVTFQVVPTLAATGSEVSPALFIGATSLLLAGAVLMILRSRKVTA